MSERIIENIKSELTRQHISFAEYRAALNITDEALTELESNNQADTKLVFDTAKYLGCSCDYICGLTENSSTSEELDKRIGFTCKGRTERLLEQLNEAQQWEVFDMISAYCLERGITYSRIDAQERREKLMNDIIGSLGQLSRKKVG